jgi:hypothetical protein
MKKRNKTIALFLILAMGLTCNPLQSNAKYDDQSGNLPGTVSDGTIYALAGVAAVGIGVLVYVLIKKNIQKKNTAAIIKYRNNKQYVLWENQMNSIAIEENTTANLYSNKTTQLIVPENTFMQEVENAAKTMPIDWVVSPMNTGYNFATNNTNGLQIGVRIRF